MALHLDPKAFAARAAAAQLLRTLANERRLMILCQLIEGERTVGALQPLVGISQSALSQHLGVLRADGLVTTRRAGQAIHYRIADADAARVLEVLASIYCPPEEEIKHDDDADNAFA